MKKILLTGFETFLNHPINPSSDILSDLEKELKVLNPNIEINTMILPVTYQDSFARVSDICAQTNFDYMIHFGLAASRSHIGLERIAINWIESEHPDNNGRKSLPQKIDQFGPDGIFSNFHPTLSSLKFDQLIDVSNSCGTYVCNYLYYKTLKNFQDRSRIIFIHLPSYDKIARQNQIELLTKLIDCVLE